jgi:branched-chain amino acid transport system permease protein
MVRIELKRDRIIFRFKDRKYEWIIEPRYWRNPLIGFLLLMGFPLLIVQYSPSLATTIVNANLYAAIVIATSWMTLGTGRINFGPQLFVGVGGYIAALLSSPMSLYYLGLSPIQTLPLALVASLATGVLTCFFPVIAGGMYYVLLTMLPPLIFYELTFIYADIFKGEVGLSGLPSLVYTGSIKLDMLITCYLSLILMIVYLILVDKIIRSRYGLIMGAINDDEEVAQAVGIDIKKVKIISYVIPAGLIGVVGWFYAYTYKSFAGITYLPLSFLIKILLIAFIGGRAQIYGCIFGGYFVSFLETFLIRITSNMGVPRAEPAIFAVTLLICLVALPEGLWGLYRKRRYREYLPTLKVRREK